MTDRAKTLEMAKEAGFDTHASKPWIMVERVVINRTLERFAALVRAQVIEEAAQVCDRLTTALDHGGNEYQREALASQCAAAIRGMKSDSGHSTARAGEASTWQPMETAPKGERILMLMKHGAIEGQWDGETGSGYYWRPMEWYPSHWMPLPAAPEAKP